MIPAIENALRIIAGAGAVVQTAAGAGRAYELLVVTELARGLHNRGIHVRVIRSDGSPFPAGAPVTYIQRAGPPGPLPTAGGGPNGLTPIVFVAPASGEEWEIWNGVEFLGRSGSTHEFDIAIVPKAIADSLRAGATSDHPVGHGIVSIECKDVGSNASLDEVRAFIARVYDTTIIHGHGQYMGFYASVPKIFPRPNPGQGYGQAENTFREDNIATYNAIVRRTGFSRGSYPLLRFYVARPFPHVTVGSQELLDFVDETSDWIQLNL